MLKTKIFVQSYIILVYKRPKLNYISLPNSANFPIFETYISIIVIISLMLLQTLLILQVLTTIVIECQQRVLVSAKVLRSAVAPRSSSRLLIDGAGRNGPEGLVPGVFPGLGLSAALEAFAQTGTVGF